MFHFTDTEWRKAETRKRAPRRFLLLVSLIFQTAPHFLYCVRCTSRGAFQRQLPRRRWHRTAGPGGAECPLGGVAGSQLPECASARPARERTELSPPETSDDSHSRLAKRGENITENERAWPGGRGSDTQADDACHTATHREDEKTRDLTLILPLTFTLTSVVVVSYQ